VDGVLSAVLAFAVGSTCLWDVDWLFRTRISMKDIPMVVDVDDPGC